MSSAELINRIACQMSRQEALECFVAACKRHDTLFITDRWFAPRKEKLLALLSDPITADEAHVLRELLWQRTPFELAFDWLAEKPLSWEEYQKTKTAMAEHNRWRTMAEGIFPWEDVDACRVPGSEASWPASWATDQPLHEHLKSKTCPCCRALLTWIFFRSPAWTWRKLCGRAGWLGLCDRCHFQVDFFLTIMN
jgi:hypothetical protein